MKFSMTRTAVAAAAVAAVAGSAAAQLEFYALTTDGTLHYSDGVTISQVGNTGINNTANSLALNWASRSGDGQMYASQGLPGALANPTGLTGTVDTGSAAFNAGWALSDDGANFPTGGGIAFAADGTMWQASQSFFGAVELYHYALDGTLINKLNVATGGGVSALQVRNDGRLMVGTDTGDLLTINENTGQIASTFGGIFDQFLDLSTGDPQFDEKWTDFASPISNFGATDVAYAITRNGDNNAHDVYRISLYTGKISFVASYADFESFGLVRGFQVVPAPASAGLLGLGGLLAARRRR